MKDCNCIFCKIAGGETQVLESIRAGSAMCVIIAGDASEGSKKMY